jgi:hypothetical protein
LRRNLRGPLLDTRRKVLPKYIGINERLIIEFRKQHGLEAKGSQWFGLKHYRRSFERLLHGRRFANRNH